MKLSNITIAVVLTAIAVPAAAQAHSPAIWPKANKCLNIKDTGVTRCTITAKITNFVISGKMERRIVGSDVKGRWSPTDKRAGKVTVSADCGGALAYHLRPSGNFKYRADDLEGILDMINVSKVCHVELTVVPPTARPHEETQATAWLRVS